MLLEAENMNPSDRMGILEYGSCLRRDFDFCKLDAWGRKKELQIPLTYITLMLRKN